MTPSKTVLALQRVRGYMKKYGFDAKSVFIDEQILDHCTGEGIQKIYHISLFLSNNPKDIWQSTHTLNLNRCTTQALDYIRDEARANNG